MKNKRLFIIIAILVIAQVYSIMTMSDIRSEIHNMNNQINNSEQRLRNDINLIYSNVETKLEEEASLIYRAETKVGKPDIDALNIPIVFTVEPKQVTSGMNISLKFSDETLKLKKDGTVFTAEKVFDLLQDEINPTIIIDNNGVKSVTQDGGLVVGNIMNNFFPRIYTYFTGGQHWYSKDDKYIYEINGPLAWDQKAVEVGKVEQAGFNSIELITEIDGKVEKTQSLKISKDTEQVEIDAEYELKKSQVIEIYAKAVDSNGFTYISPIVHHTAGQDDGQREAPYEQVKIIAPNGKVIFDDTAK